MIFILRPLSVYYYPTKNQIWKTGESNITQKRSWAACQWVILAVIKKILLLRKKIVIDTCTLKWKSESTRIKVGPEFLSSPKKSRRFNSLQTWNKSSTLSSRASRKFCIQYLSKNFCSLLTCSPKWSVGGLLLYLQKTKILHSSPTNFHKSCLSKIIPSHLLQCNITHPDLKNILTHQGSL